MRYHVYLTTSLAGCAPLLSTRPLPWKTLREVEAGFLILPRGSYVRIEHAFEEMAEIIADDQALAAERFGS